SVRPWAVINTAGFVRVDLAEREVERCMAINATGAAALAQVCLRLGIRLLTFSSDLVFDGAQSTPYLESDPVAPLSVYGQSKVQAEQLVGRLLEDALIVRTSAFFGPEDAANFVTMTLSALLRGERVRAASDVTISPTYVPHLTHACLELLIDGASGIWHLANQGALSWHELAERAGRLLGVSLEGLDPCRFADLQLPAPRPSNSVLSSERAQLMPTLDEGLADYASHVASQFRGQARPRGDLNTDMA
ncbi:MAG: dTDP-4-dehydrorhamnose reductase, partial [Myxococcaceae bacterium]|nr:dTDP-4-dehydrorhamnose reductase [Myxococcaceae bacterium]